MENLFNHIEGVVARHFGIRPECFFGKCRLRHETDAKHFLVFLLKDIYGYRQKDITTRYGYSKRNVFNSAQQIREGVKHQPFYSRHYMAIMRSLEQDGAPAPTSININN